MFLTDIINDPIRLSEWCDSNLISSDINRMNAGEVFTPLHLIDDMFRPMNNIDPDYIHKDMKLLDLCGGRGNAAAYMYNMLYYNKNIMNDFPDDNDRKQHILKNMLYISEIDPTNISILKDLFGENNENIIHGDAIGKNANGSGILSVKNPTKFKLYKYFQEKDIKFDIIFTNPPYQGPNLKNPGKFNGQPFYFHFIRLAIELLKENGLLFAIHPPTWKKYSYERSRHDTDWFIKDCTFLYLNVSDKEDKFEGKTQKAVDYYILKKKINDNSVKTFIESEYNEEKDSSEIIIRNDSHCLPKHISEKTIELFNKLNIGDENRMNIKFIRKGPGNDFNKDKLRFHYVKNKKCHLNEPSEEYPYKIYGQFNNGTPDYNYTSINNENKDKNKIIMGVKIKLKDFNNSILIDLGGIIPGNECLHILDDDEDNLRYYEKLLKSNLFKYILYLSSYSRTNQGDDQIEYQFLNKIYFPKKEFIDLDNINKSLYEFYKFSIKDIIMVNNIINDKEELISDNWRSLKEEYGLICTKGFVISSICNKCIKQEININNIQDDNIIVTINNETFKYDYLNNKYYEINTDEDITMRCIIKYYLY